MPATMTVTAREMMIASIGKGAGIGAGTAGGAGAVGAGYTTDGAVIEGTMEAITIVGTGTALTVNVPESPFTSTL